MEKEITYKIVAVTENKVKLKRTIKKTWWRIGRYGCYLQTTERSSVVSINLSRLEWLIKRAYEGVRVATYPSDVEAINLLLDEGFEFQEDPWYLLWMIENDWEM